MSRRARERGPLNGPWARLVRSQAAPVAALAVLTFVSALLGVAVPAATAAGYDRAAASAVGTDPDLRVEGQEMSDRAAASVPDVVEMAQKAAQWHAALPVAFRDASGDPEASVTTERTVVAGKFERARTLYLAWDFGASRRVRFVAGRAPENDMPGSSFEGGAPPQRTVRIALSKRFADAFGYKVGDELALSDASVAKPGARTYEIAGLYEPLNAGDPYWRDRRGMLEPQVRTGPEGTLFDEGTALLDANGYLHLLSGEPRRLTYVWRFPIRPGDVTARTAERMADGLEEYRARVAGRSDLFRCSVATALDGRLASFFAQLRTARVVLSLAFSGLLAVVAGVLLLAAGMLGERLRPALGTMRARGASLRQLAAPAGALTAVAVVPAAALGYGAGLLLDAGPPQAASAYVVGALAALLLALPAALAALAVREHGGGLVSAAGRREDLSAVRPTMRRLVLEALFVVLAAVGVVLLRRRGLAGQAATGADPLVAAAPVLLAVAVGLLVLRAYPYPLRAAARMLRRSRSTVAFVGVARAARGRPVTALPLVVLLLAATVAGFAATVGAALGQGQERAARHRVGGDAHVHAEQFEPGVVARVRAVRGVRAAVPARVITEAVVGAEPAPDAPKLTVVAVDLAAYRDLGAGTGPLPSPPRAADGVLLSPAAERMVRGRHGGQGGHGGHGLTLSWLASGPVKVTVAGRVDSFPGRDADEPYAIVPYRMLKGTQAYATDVYAAGHGIDAGGLRSAVATSIPKGTRTGGLDRVVEVREDVLRGMARVPMVRVVHDAFRDCALVVAGYGLLAVLLVLLVGARERAAAVAHLRVLGLSARQRRGLALVEIAPVAVCAVAAGWALGLLLPGITGPVVDLRPYTGGFRAGTFAVDPLSPLAPLGALLPAAVAAVAVDRAFETRRGLGGTLRTEDEG